MMQYAITSFWAMGASLAFILLISGMTAFFSALFGVWPRARGYARSLAALSTAAALLLMVTAPFWSAAPLDGLEPGEFRRQARLWAVIMTPWMSFTGCFPAFHPELREPLYGAWLGTSAMLAGPSAWLAGHGAGFLLFSGLAAALRRFLGPSSAAPRE